MAIELPREVDELDRRLASLEDPAFAAHLAEENPSLYLRTLAQRDKEARKRTRWSAWLAGTAVVSLAAGMFAGPFVTKMFAPAPVPRHTAATVKAVVPRPAPAHHRAEPKPRALVAAPMVVAPKPETRHALAPVVAPKPLPKVAPQTAHATAHVTALAPAAQAPPAPQAAAAPATAASAGQSQADRLLAMPDPALPSYAKAAPPGSGLSEHGAGSVAPVLVGRDPCTPQGGRIGAVLLGSIAR